MKALQKIQDLHLLDDVLDEDEQAIWAYKSGYRNIIWLLIAMTFVGMFFVLFLLLSVYVLIKMVFIEKAFEPFILLMFFFVYSLGLASKMTLQKINEAYNLFYAVTSKRAILIETGKQQAKVTVFPKEEIANCYVTKSFFGMNVLFKDIDVHVNSSYRSPTTTNIQGTGFKNIRMKDFAELMILLDEFTETDNASVAEK